MRWSSPDIFRESTLIVAILAKRLRWVTFTRKESHQSAVRILASRIFAQRLARIVLSLFEVVCALKYLYKMQEDFDMQFAEALALRQDPVLVEARQQRSAILLKRARQGDRPLGIV